ncbi:MAG TPA: hypothetical protein VMF06_02570 [Candidatus Limnocylindria bacterium]|nr:hypothetical protein [Candidatus Limnocylindria bacterium]
MILIPILFVAAAVLAIIVKAIAQAAGRNSARSDRSFPSSNTPDVDWEPSRSADVILPIAHALHTHHQVENGGPSPSHDSHSHSTHSGGSHHDSGGHHGSSFDHGSSSFDSGSSGASDFGGGGGCDSSGGGCGGDSSSGG